MTIAAPMGRGRIADLLSLVGVLGVAAGLIHRVASGTDAWAVVGIAAAVGWGVLVVSRDRAPRVALVTAIITSTLAGLSAAPTDVIGVVPAIGALLTIVGRPERSVRDAVLVTAGAVVGVGVGAVLAPSTPSAVAGALAGVALGTLGAVSRRQFRAADAQSRALLEERARTAAAEERTRIARDLHDVLAHSLGALVIQLDAADAELDSGATDAAHTRVRAARVLAADGLDDARRAVTALRELPTLEVVPAIETLIAAHRSLGGTARVDISGHPTEVAFVAVLRELLTNARRHAPGATVSVEVTERSLTVSNPSPAVRAASAGAGAGLIGVRERSATLGGSVDIDDGDPFTVTFRVPR